MVQKVERALGSCPNVQRSIQSTCHQVKVSFAFHIISDPKKSRKINYPVSILAIISPLVYITVLIKIKMFKRKHEIVLPVLPNHQRPLPSSLGFIFNTSLVDLATVAVSLLTVVSVAGAALIIGMLDINYLRSHQHLVYFHFHGLPNILLTVVPIIYLSRNPRLKDFFLKGFQNKVFTVKE